MSDKVDLIVKKITRDRQGHYIMIKEEVHREDIAILSVYTPNTTAKNKNKKKPDSAKRRSCLDKYTGRWRLPHPSLNNGWS